jgi:hypothetical protein
MVFLELILVGCSLAACSNEKAEPNVVPFEGAPVTATVDGKVLIIDNNTENHIFPRVFPTDILPAIEWAPCIAPEPCPVEQRIDSGSEKRINLREIVREQTVSVTVFWWTYLEKLPGASVPPMEMDEIEVPLP